MALSSSQITTIRSTAPILKEHGNAITSSFYTQLLADHPSLNDVFNQTNQRNNHQPRALADALYAYATHIDDLGSLSHAVEMICQKHASLYIKPEQYSVVGEYLLKAMGDILGDVLTPDIFNAWSAAYWQLANLMIGREAHLMQEAEGWTDWRDWRIERKVLESKEITSFYLKPENTDEKVDVPLFKPGQYISVRLDVPDLQHLQSRQYSLSDAPGLDYYRISVKRETVPKTGEANGITHPGVISNILHDTKHEGDKIRISHPRGEFFLNPKTEFDKPVVLLGAGVGLTPLVSILNTLVRESEQRISFVHTARSPGVRAFASHCRGIAPNVTYKSFVKSTDPTDDAGKDFDVVGRFDPSLLDREHDLLLSDDRTLYFVCGPESFMADVSRDLKAMGVAGERIRMEVFGVGTVA